MKYQFKDDFIWGAASSATQSEGTVEGDGKGKNIWDVWYEKEAKRFFNSVSPCETSTFYNHAKEDIERMKALNFNSYRTSISWSRLIPAGIGEVNEKAVEFYNFVIDEMKANGIEPMLTLFHFDMPAKMQEMGGWESRAVVDAYAEYAKKCFKLFGHNVKYWFTHNEPIVPAEGGYLHDFHYPNLLDFKKAVQVGYHEILSSAIAISEYRKLNLSGKIGIVLNLGPVYPRSQQPADLEAARIGDMFNNKAFLDPSIKGEYPGELIDFLKEHDLLPVYSKEDLDIIKENTIDTLGINYYAPTRVKAKEHLINPNAPLTPRSFYDLYEMPGRQVNEFKNWEIYPEGLYDMAIRFRDEYNNIPWYVSENGIGIPEDGYDFSSENDLNDDYRIKFIKEHLEWLHKGIEEGSNCFGYHIWTFIDCWSWMNAYRNRYGLYALNLKTQERRIKKSGKWYREVIKNSGF